MKLLSAITLLTLISCSCYGQKDSHAVYWLRYQNQLNFSENLYWNNEVDNRRFISPDVQTQFIMHSRLHYKIPHWDFAGGLSLSWQYAGTPERPVSHATQEFRPVLEASYEIPVRKALLSQRIRLDNRFFEEDKLTTDLFNTTYVARFRYRLQVRLPLTQSNKVNLRIADEVMVNARENFFDQNRVYVTSEYIITKHLSMEAGYIYIYQQRFRTTNFVERHVLRFSILHKLFFY